MLDCINFIFICIGLPGSLDAKLPDALVNLKHRLFRLEAGNSSPCYFFSSQPILSAVGKVSYRITTCRKETAFGNDATSPNPIFSFKAGEGFTGTQFFTTLHFYLSAIRLLKVVNCFVLKRDSHNNYHFSVSLAQI